MKDMLGRGEAISVEEALKRLLGPVSPGDIPTEHVSLDDALGRVLSSNVRAPEDLPGFARSTMDGYAVLAADTFGAGEHSPAYMEVSHEILMGTGDAGAIARSTAAKIATGGMLPEGADAVVMFEYVQALEGSMIEVLRAVAPGENVIQKGEDASKGDLVLGAGRRLRPQDVAILAGIGLDGAEVYQRPKVAIIPTGDEIVPAGAPLPPGCVRDINSHTLSALLRRDGGDPLRLAIVPDEFEALKSSVMSAVEGSSMVLITGGSSVGTKDVTEKVINELGELLFHSVTLKPGKPTLAGMVRGVPVLGLPGHPRAVAVTYEIFARPLLSRCAGLGPEGAGDRLGRTVRAVLTRSVHSSAGRREMISLELTQGSDGLIMAAPVLGKSGLISMLVRADGTLTVPIGVLGYEKGEEVEVNLF